VSRQASSGSRSGNWTFVAKGGHVGLAQFLARLVVSISQFANKHGVYLGRRSSKAHVALYRWSGGKFGGHVPGWPGARILLLDHTGTRSGVRRTSPVIYHEEGDLISVAASKGGQPTHPAWFHNLIAQPETTIQIGSVIRSVRARVATDAERKYLWPKFVAAYPGYDFFQRNARGRKIPIVILDPRTLS
jgi:deazaflavin-dependent oxidoreductase (nitroreductase family)